MTCHENCVAEFRLGNIFLLLVKTEKKKKIGAIEHYVPNHEKLG